MVSKIKTTRHTSELQERFRSKGELRKERNERRLKNRRQKQVSCVSYWLQVSCAKLVYREKRNKIVISRNTNYGSDYSVTCSITTVVKSFAGIFQRICQNFKTRKQEILILRCFRSSSLSAFCKIGVLKTSAKFLGKHIYRRVSFQKGCRPFTLKF